MFSFDEDRIPAKWTTAQAKAWYDAQPWLIGCNFLPSSAINQLEMWQAETYDPTTLRRELGWARSLGFNTLRVYLHDLLWESDRDGFIHRIDDFLNIAQQHGMRPTLVLFDDCHRPDPVSGAQPLPIHGVHNSGWKHSPGQTIVQQFYTDDVAQCTRSRLEDYVCGVLQQFSSDERILMWDLYNEPGQSGNGDTSHALLKETWGWAHSVRPTQPLTACLDGSVGEKNIALNAERSDIITFHHYQSDMIEKAKHRLTAHDGRPVICTEYMARELGTTFQNSLPFFKENRIGCYNWGLVAGKSQTHFNWATVKRLEELSQQGAYIEPGKPIPEPPLWFHDIFRVDGTPFDQAEIDFIRTMTQE